MFLETEQEVYIDKDTINQKKMELLNDFWGSIYQTVNHYANKEFIVTKEGAITFSQANNLANIYHKAILSQTSETQVGIGFYLEDPLKIVPGMLGVMKSKNYFIVIDTNFPKTTITNMIRDADIKVILTDTEFLPRLKSFVGDSVRVVDLAKLDTQYQVPNPEIDFSPDDILQIIFTSGSTGKPKGVIEDYRYLARAMTVRKLKNDYLPETRASQVSSYTFGGPHMSVFTSLAIGYTIYIYYVRKEGFIGLKDWIQQNEITYFQATPTVLRNLMSVLDPEDKFPSVIKVAMGGEKRFREELPKIRQYFPNVKKLRLGFAGSEVQQVSSHYYSIDHPFEEGALPCGFPSPDINVYFWDEEGNEVPSGEPGEIVIYSDSLSRGYISNPELTQERYIQDPVNPLFQYFKTGDIGRILPGGDLMYLGRKDNMVKIKGVRIELSSIENHLLSYPGIAQAAVKAVEDKRKNIKLCAYIVPDQGIQIPLSDLRKHLASRLPRHLLPHFLIPQDQFPNTRTGKIDYKLLPIPEMVRPPLEYPYEPPKDDLEKTLVRIWEELIGIEGIGVTDDFFDVGGDSLIGVLLFVQIEKELGRELPVSVLLSASTIRQQAEIIRSNNLGDELKPVIPINVNGENPPLFFIPGKGGYPTRIRHLAKKIDKNTPIYALQDLMEHEQGPSKNKEFPSTAAFYINQIKRLYPQGPYYLVGESLGGKLALEMAQQLREAGDEVPILAMLDTYHNDGRVMNKLMEPKNRQIYYRMLFNKHWTILRDSDWAGRWDYFKFYRENILEKISKRIKRFISKGKNSPAAALPEKIKRLEEANLQADQEYVSQYYPGKVIFFKALLGPNSGVENNGWEIDEFGEFVIHELNCYHGSILFEPIVSQVAEVIQHYIDLETSQTE